MCVKFSLSSNTQQAHGEREFTAYVEIDSYLVIFSVIRVAWNLQWSEHPCLS